MTVDLSPLIQAAISLGVVALSTVGTWAIARLAQKLGVEKNSAAMANMTSAAMHGISFAAMTLQTLITAKGWAHPDVQNQLVAAGAQYVADKFPDVLKQAGIDPTTPAGQQAIADLVMRTLPAGTAAAAASPTTPAAPPAPAAVQVAQS